MNRSFSEPVWGWRGRDLLLALVFLLAWSGSALAQGWGPPVADPIQASLLARDEMVRRYYILNFPADPRYEAVLSRIGNRVNAQLHKVFPNSEEEVTYGVFLSNLGFNGVAWHRVVILDSLLLDALHRVAEAVAVYGRLENSYVDQLAAFIGMLGTQGGYGAPLRDRARIDPENPYRIPPPPGLTFQAQRRAEEIFEDMLAAWVCHELSHCYLGHAREKIEEGLRLQNRYGGQVPPWVLEGQIQQHLNYRLAPAKELQADRAGALVAFHAGYTLEGFRRWYAFIDRIEQHTGTAFQQHRTHPHGTQRFQAVQEVFESWRAEQAGQD
jgi:hypothetical protein